VADDVLQTKTIDLQRNSTVAGGVVMAGRVRSCVTAGVAIAGAGMWGASVAGVPSAAAAPAIRLTSVDSVLSPPLAPQPNSLCPDQVCDSVFGPAFSTPTPPKLAAAITTPAADPATDPLSAFIAVFISNGTADHPDAGLLIGNGYQGAPGQRGGNGGLLFGDGGAGGTGAVGI